MACFGNAFHKNFDYRKGPFGEQEPLVRDGGYSLKWIGFARSRMFIWWFSARVYDFGRRHWAVELVAEERADDDEKGSGGPVPDS